MITPTEYASRRGKLFDKLPNNSATLLFSGFPPHCSADEDYDFEVNRNFYYLTGINQEGVALLLINEEGQRNEYLFIPPFDPVKEKWYGKKLTIEEAKDISLIHNVLLDSALDAKLNLLFGEEDSLSTLLLDLEPELKIGRNLFNLELKEILESKYAGLTIDNVYPLITRLRMVKSPEEIAMLKSAIETTKLGILSVICKAKKGVHEYELADEFLHVINDDNRYQGLAFPTIMASGSHTCVLHYPTPKDSLKDGDLLLMDLGARDGFYCADISRTIPISGKFNKQQKLIYSIVLEANKDLVKFAKPGLTLEELNDHVIEFLSSACLKAKLIDKKEDIGEVYFHHCSHHIGLDTHDPGDSKERNTPLEAGNIISDEPGLYFASLGIGVRIEDDLLITENGAICLSSSIPKEIEDIENLCSQNKAL